MTAFGAFCYKKNVKELFSKWAVVSANGKNGNRVRQAG